MVHKNKTSPGKVNATERRRTALEMRKAGAPLRVIAEELGISIPTVHAHIVKALAEIQKVMKSETGNAGVESVFFTSFVMQ